MCTERVSSCLWACYRHWSAKGVQGSEGILRHQIPPIWIGSDCTVKLGHAPAVVEMEMPGWRQPLLGWRARWLEILSHRCTLFSFLKLHFLTKRLILFVHQNPTYSRAIYPTYSRTFKNLFHFTKVLKRCKAINPLQLSHSLTEHRAISVQCWGRSLWSQLINYIDYTNNQGPVEAT